jgi:hypothetical protein
MSPLFTPHTAAAQPSPTPQIPALNTLSICKNYTLTGPEFIKLLQKIVKHGDLTDIPFLERTFRTKFSVSELDYGSDQMLGAPIKIDIHLYSRQPEKGTMIASMFISDDLELEPKYLRNCLHLSRNDFYTNFGSWQFGGAPLPTPSLKGDIYEPPTSEVAFQYFHNVGKYDSEFELGFDYSLKDFLVSDVFVTQRK